MRLNTERTANVPRLALPPGSAEKKTTAICQRLQVKPELHRGGSNLRSSMALPRLPQQLWKHVWTEWETISTQALLSTGYAELCFLQVAVTWLIVSQTSNHSHTLLVKEWKTCFCFPL